MKYIEIDELKRIQIDILDDVANFCEENNICYFLAFGTLIGAIRHNGYIPWDDDIDIAMPRPDYNRFIQQYNNRKSNYRMMCFETDESYSLPFGKVIDDRTILCEDMYDETATYGVYIDVFPIDGYPGKKDHKKLIHLRQMLNAKKAVFGKGRSKFKELIILFGKLYLLFSSVDEIVRKIITISQRTSYQDAKLVGYLPALGGTFENSIIDKEKVLSSFPFHTFEGHQYRIPIGYDSYLTQIYGDYMKCPSEDKRQSTHIFKAWWK